MWTAWIGSLKLQLCELHTSYVDMQEAKGQAPIILIHDRKATVEALPSLLLELKKRGYALAPLNESIKPHQFKLK
ncbi:hypothetical protein [Cytobacillus firmus]|uniref:hypothetical protein n=1 Tax=Cytobacillus firmus TaxID=1399 RepID=UPI0018CD1195|nr:hypothetical protein [Cytobacillus firmus]MBG9586552.1 hypothetical protein [Cytobacillus firmus]